ncbi:hypothetical protein D3C78_1998020 [compost metagenome]
MAPTSAMMATIIATVEFLPYRAAMKSATEVSFSVFASSTMRRMIGMPMVKARIGPV